MRSSKSRSRSKPNRPRTLGNIINRVFDSSGPEGKVRGTPQQLIEKYQQLGRDAQLSNDRVAAENYMQHSEHYTRLLAEAMREMAAEQEARQSQQGQSGNANSGGSQNSGGNQNGNGNGNYSQPRNDRPEYRNDRNDGSQQPRFDQPRNDQSRNDQPRNDQNRNDQQRNDQNRNDQPRNDQNRNDQPRNDQQRNDQNRNDNRSDTRPDGRSDQRFEPRADRGNDRGNDRRDDRRDDRRTAPADVVTFAEVDEETGLVQTPEARRVQPVEAAPVVVPAVVVPAVPPAEESTKRARAPRRPRVESDTASAPETDVIPAEKPARSRGPAKPREAAE